MVEKLLTPKGTKVMGSIGTEVVAPVTATHRAAVSSTHIVYVHFSDSLDPTSAI